MKLKLAKINVGLANGIISHPFRITENVLLTVNKLSYLIDFVIIYMKDYCFAPVLLGRSFFFHN